MSPSPLACSKCKTPVAVEAVNRGGFTPCPACGVPLQVEIFPALFRRIAPGKDGELTMVEGESSCFYHPQKKAILPCEGCGRFLCALCDCELHGQHFCPTCLEVGQSKGKIKNLQNTRVLYDSIALALAVLPVVLVITVYFTFITAPAALFIALRHWNAPMSIVRRSKVRYVIAIVFATLQVVGWCLVIAVIFFMRPRSHG